ncbi:MAG TPA: acetoacetate--CoA ligase [Gemmatimonadaceae bacterium]|nr:acetoacetate--CoA ligase [Gemmatimonadaceae bacterium]
MPHPLWTPSQPALAHSNMARFIAFVRDEGAAVRDYPTLYAWSVDQREAFWSAVWRFCGVVADDIPGHGPWYTVLVGRERVAPPTPELGPTWFLGARLNFAENLLRHDDDHPAVVAWGESGRTGGLTYRELHEAVARAAAALRADGITAGDRVAAFMPNVPETVIFMLAAASIGAVWSSCSPDFGVNGVLDRFGQIQPRVLLAAAEYRYGGKRIDCLPRVREIAAGIPGIERVVVVPQEDRPADVAGLPRGVLWNEYVRAAEPAPTLEFARLPFDHPLYIMYSSGTTGLPKCMVHGAGGTLLQHLKEHALHVDIGRDDRVFYFTTCGWMMWNWLVSALALGATVVLYDGAAILPRAPVLWDMAEQERITVFGTSAKFIALTEKEGRRPRDSHDLSALRGILSTGSPLAAHSFDYVYEHVKPDVQLSSISGGTDIISCFALGNPILPVWRGELQCRGLGMAVEVFDEQGRPAPVGQAGELVCTAPFPSMPVKFWNDPDGRKYHEAYFDVFPNVWRHGDWAARTGHDGLIIHGRSDATLNPQGVRIGTAEIYRQVEQMDEVVESVVVGQDVTTASGSDVRVVLFVRLRKGLVLDEALRERIRQRIRANASPHHVPGKILAVADIPRTISGKISELAVRNVIHGRPVKNTDALANPRALELYRDLPELNG